MSTKQSPWPFWILAAIVGALTFFVAIPIQIATSEAYFAGGSSVSLRPNWNIYQQGADLLQGNLSSTAMGYVFPAFGAEVIAFVVIIAVEIIHDKIKKTNPTLAKGFRFLGWGVVIFNCLTDFGYAPQGTFMGRVLFTIILSLVVYVGGWATAALFEYGAHVSHPTAASPKP